MKRTEAAPRNALLGRGALLASLVLHALAAACFVCLAPAQVPGPALPVLVLSASVLGDASEESYALAAPGGDEDTGASSPEQAKARTDAPVPEAARPQERPAAKRTRTQAKKTAPAPSREAALKTEPASLTTAQAGKDEPAGFPGSAGSAEAAGSAGSAGAGAGHSEPGTTKARTGGAGRERPDAASAYFGTILSRLEQMKRYPDAARKLGREGTVLVRFELDRAGALVSWRIEKGSGLDELDREVESMVHKAAPFPPFPDDMDRDRLVLVVPVSFSLKQG